MGEAVGERGEFRKEATASKIQKGEPGKIDSIAISRMILTAIDLRHALYG